jgi:hypothetical protein
MGSACRAQSPQGSGRQLDLLAPFHPRRSPFGCDIVADKIQNVSILDHMTVGYRALGTIVYIIEKRP